MSGNYVSASDPASTTIISNAGQITAADGGFVVLSASQVQNSGLIQARLGTIALASGSAFTLTLSDSGPVEFQIDAAALSDTAGVANLGSLVADGGAVLLQAKVASNMLHTVVNNQGQISATDIEGQGDRKSTRLNSSH